MNSDNNNSVWIERIFFSLIIIELVLMIYHSNSKTGNDAAIGVFFSIICSYFTGECDYDNYYDYLLFPLIILSIIILYKSKKDKRYNFYKHTILFSKIFIFLGVIRFIYEFLLPRFSDPLF